MNELTKQDIADEMTRIMADPKSDAMTLTEIKDWAVANLTAELKP